MPTKKRFRSAITGRFLRAAEALRNAATSIAETIKGKKKDTHGG